MNPLNRKCYSIGGRQYFTKSIMTKMKKIGKARIVLSPWYRGEKVLRHQHD